MAVGVGIRTAASSRQVHRRIKDAIQILQSEARTALFEYVEIFGEDSEILVDCQQLGLEPPHLGWSMLRSARPPYRQ